MSSAYIPGVLHDKLLRLAVICHPLIHAHGQRTMNSVRRAHPIPGVKQQAAGQPFRRAREFREQQDAVAVFLADNVLVGDQVHAVADGGDKADGGGGVQGEEIFEGYGLVEEVDGLVGWSAC
jgi:hypothetical protein